MILGYAAPGDGVGAGVYCRGSNFFCGVLLWLYCTGFVFT